MRKQALVLGLAALMGAAGCGRPASQEGEPQELGPELKSLVLDEAPSDVPNRTLIDFGGKADLIGYSVTPDTLAAPGSKLSLKTFWRSGSRLGEGYQLYTELVTPAGKRFEIEGGGPLRKGQLTPSSWQPGKVYIDELEITVPEELDAARFSIVVGLKTAPLAPEQPEDDAKAEDKPAKAEGAAAAGTFGQVYLAVVSGLADAKHGGIVAELETGITPGAKRARNVKATGPGKRPVAPGQLPQLKPGQAVRMPSPSPSPPGSAR
jgi:hypothetical protein